MRGVVHGYKLYRTENISINGAPHTVRFSVRDDGLEHVLFVINDINGDSVKGKYNECQAKDFNRLSGENLEAKVQQIMAGYIENECITI